MKTTDCREYKAFSFHLGCLHEKVKWIHSEIFVKHIEHGMTKSNIVNILKENEFETRFLYPDILQFWGKDN